MELLKQRILRDGQVKEGGVLKVDSFLNHQMDVTLLNEIGREFRRRFDGAAITKIVTIEASGIGIAAIAAQHFGSVPVIFAKKTRSRNLDGALYTVKVHSFTKDVTYDVQLSKNFSARRTLCSSWTISSPGDRRCWASSTSCGRRARSALAAASSLKSSSRAAARWCGQRECAWNRWP